MFSTICKRAFNPTLAPRLVSAMSFKKISTFETISVSVPKPYVYHVELNRPKNYNALNKTLWLEIKQCFEEINDDQDCRVVVLTGAGKHFCAGIDLKDMLGLGQELAEHEDVARKCRLLLKTIKVYQDSMSSLEKCVKPVISAVHSACIGAGVELILAADIRYCTKDAWFQVKEVDIGMAADVGSLQRLSKVIGSLSLVRELCYTARKMPSEEALSSGFVSKLFNDRDSMVAEAMNMAEVIAEKSPVAVQISKQTLVYSLDHTTQEGLDYIALHNQAMLQSEDFVNACMAQATKGDKPVFSKL